VLPPRPLQRNLGALTVSIYLRVSPLEAELLQDAGRIIQGSSAIIDYVDEHSPEPPAYPSGSIRTTTHVGPNSALMTSQHAPYRGGKPYSNMRVWVLRDGRWQLALSQQVTIQSAGSLSAVASTQ
jgi:hypothetical protein